LLFTNTIPNGSSVLLKREIFNLAGKFDVNLRLAADWKLWVKVLMISDIAFISEELNYFRRHSNTVRSLSVENCSFIEEELLVKKFIIDASGLVFSDEVVSQACELMKTFWFDSLFHFPNKVSVGRHIRIYRLLSSMEPTIAKQIIMQLFKRLPRLLKKPYMGSE